MINFETTATRGRSPPTLFIIIQHSVYIKRVAS